MEKEEREHITKNLPELLQLTHCNITLLAVLRSEDILSYEDTSTLSDLPNPLDKVAKLYEVVQTRHKAFSSLLKALRISNQSGALVLLEKLHGEQPPESVQEAPEIIDLDNLAPLVVTVNRPTHKMAFKDDFYKLENTFKGFALILNITVYEDPHTTNRNGANYDTDYMRDLWLALGYIVKIKEGYFTKPDVQQIIKKFKVKFKNCPKLYGRKLDLYKDLVYKFDKVECPQLDQQPKIFIIQTCQTFSSNEGVAMEDNHIEPPVIGDTIICYACLPGCDAFRHVFLGTYYTYALTKVFMEKAHCMDLHRLLNTVHETLKNILVPKLNSGQLCFYLDIGMKTLYFNMPPA